MWDYFVLAAYLFGAALNIYLVIEIWRQRGACWRFGLGVALVIIFAGMFTDKLKVVRQSSASEVPATHAL